MDNFVLNLAENLDLALTKSLECGLNEYISLLNDRLKYRSDEEKQQLYLIERKNIISELERNPLWQIYIVDEKRIDFLSVLIKKEILATSFKYDEKIRYDIVKSIYPDNIKDKDIFFSLVLKIKNSLVNINIKASLLFIVFYPLLNRIKVEYVNRQIASVIPENISNREIIEISNESGNIESLSKIIGNTKKNKIKKESEDKRSLNLKIHNDPAIKKCCVFLKKHNFISDTTQSSIFINVFSGKSDVKKVRWISSVMALSYFIHLIMPFLSKNTTDSLWIRTVNSFEKEDGTLFTKAGLNGAFNDLDKDGDEAKLLIEAAPMLKPKPLL